MEPTAPAALPDLVALARAAGAAGVCYSDWASSEAVFAAVEAYDAAGVRFRTRDYEKAHGEGRREWRLAGGWRSFWTTAPADYDFFGTETAEECGPWHGKALRRVVANPDYADYQAARYGSGLHGTWEHDPRVEEARLAAERERERAEEADRASRRAAGLVWLAGLDDAALSDEALGDGEAFDAELRARCLSWRDAEVEKRARRERRQAAERAATWARCRAAFADGVTLIDKGAPSRVVETPGLRPFRVPGRDPRAWRSVAVKPHYACADDAAAASVVGEGGEVVGPLELVADRLERGEYRLAGPEEHVAPLAVVSRLGCPFTDVMRVEADGSVAWVGRCRSYDLLVLDDVGHLVRKGAVRRAAERAYLTKQFAGHDRNVIAVSAENPAPVIGVS